MILTPRTIENGVPDETRTIPTRMGREIAPVPVFAFVGRLVREKGSTSCWKQRQTCAPNTFRQ